MQLEFKYSSERVSQNHQKQITGYASVFNVADTYSDIVAQGAFADSILANLSGKQIPLLWQHHQEQPIGKVEYLTEDGHGLYIKATILQNIAQGKEAIELINLGSVCGLSIGYKPLLWSYDAQYRILEKVDLWEVSVVTFPANQYAQITPNQ